MKNYYKLYEQKEEEYKRMVERKEKEEEYKKDLSVLWEERECDNFQKGYANLFLGMIEEILDDDLSKPSAIDKSLQSKVRDFSFVLENCIKTIGDPFHGGKLMTIVRSAKDYSHQWDYTDSHYGYEDIFKYICETLQFYGFKKIVHLPYENKYSGSRAYGKMIETDDIFELTIPFRGTIEMLINMYFSELQKIEYEGNKEFITGGRGR